jgi:hypothetical protein
MAEKRQRLNGKKTKMTSATSTKITGMETRAVPSPLDQSRAPRRYIYCVIDGDASASLGLVGIDGQSEVFAVPHHGIAAVVSATTQEKLEISRGNALAHQRVMEAVMQRGHTVLPVRFNTIAEDKGGRTAQQRLIDHVLVARRDEVLGLLSTMHERVEVGVKGLWMNMDAVFGDIVASNPQVQALRKKLLGGGVPGAPGRRPTNMTGQIKLGEMVKQALEVRKGATEAALLGRLTPLAKDFRKNKTFGDSMFANLALLVEKSRQESVVTALSAFEAEQGVDTKLRCVGPLPPCNFLELVITWDE